jgi:hypothetical protein
MDVERCRLLLESTERWVAPPLKHYLVIAKRDVPLFRPMLTSRTTLVVVEDMIPKWLFRLPGMKRFWFSLKTRPVKNWILQQIVKLSAPQLVKEDVLLFADSDMFFIAPFDPRIYERDDRVPLFLETGQRGLIPNNDAWQATCSRLLGLEVEPEYDTNYIGQLIWWRRQNALATVARVEELAGRSWQQCVAPLSGFSEYVLYGLHSHKVLGERSGHWHDGTVRTLCYWGTDTLDTSALEKFSGSRGPQHHSAMISAKSGTSLQDVRRVFGYA